MWLEKVGVQFKTQFLLTPAKLVYVIEFLQIPVLNTCRPRLGHVYDPIFI